MAHSISLKDEVALIVGGAGGMVTAVVMAKWEGELDHARMQAVLNGDVPTDSGSSEVAMQPSHRGRPVHAHIKA